jgi:hypothetical protein
LLKWFSRRLIREHAKLLIQTSCASEVLAEGWYSRDPETVAALKRRAIIVSEIGQDFDKSIGLPSDVVSYLLELNKELRRLHDAGPAIAGDGFDAAYRPLGGYDAAIDRFLDD